MYKLAVSIVLKSISNQSIDIGKGDGASSVIEVVGYECPCRFLTNKTTTIYILGVIPPVVLVSSLTYYKYTIHVHFLQDVFIKKTAQGKHH